MAAVSFGNDAILDFDLDDHTTEAAVLAAVDGIVYRGGNTNTTGGLREMRRNVFSADGGDRSNVRDICILITDGMPTREVGIYCLRSVSCSSWHVSVSSRQPSLTVVYSCTTFMLTTLFRTCISKLSYARQTGVHTARRSVCPSRLIFLHKIQWKEGTRFSSSIGLL